MSEAGDNVVREINADTHDESVIAGDTGQGFMGDKGVATNAELNYPFCVCVDASSNVFIGDLLNFRIRVVGTYVPTAIPQIPASGSFVVYPNPATNILNIAFASSSGLGKNTIQIIDITGRTIRSFDRNANPDTILPLDVSTLSAGIYFLQIISDNNTSSQVVKFIKD